jgi:two-component system chemotaxis sensor kinase CheA
MAQRGSQQEAAPAAATMRSANELIDELSTRLMIGGAGKLTAYDFGALCTAASAEGMEVLAEAASALAAKFRSGSKTPLNEREELATKGLEQFRELLAGGMPEAIQALATSSPIETELNVYAEDVEMIEEFITESREHLVAIEGKMLELEADSTSSEVINAVFRGFHTIKGLAGFLEFASIQQVAHDVETLLDLARTGKLAISPSVVDVVLESTDYIKREIAGIDRKLKGGAAAPSEGNADLLLRIRAASTGEPVSPEASSATPEPPAKPEEDTMEEWPAEPAAAQSPEPSPIPEDPRRPTTPAINPTEVTNPAPVREERRSSDIASVRIETAKLDHLMNMVGEMVIAQTLISHNPAFSAIKDTRLMANLAQLTRITADVQKVTTSMRMVPIGLQFQKTARVIRDLSRRAGKQIVMAMSGEDTELDKAIAEELSDPLLHMVRNSVDHGIETAEERLLTCKDRTAHIRLAAYHQSGQIVIEISDDGRGLNKEKILKKATERGIVKPGAQLSDSEIFLLIFEAGFSTAEQVTDISGRGVGMDVVRRHVQKLRGRIDIQSEQGVGTTFFLKLPLTLAIIEGLVVVVGDNRYILPIFSITEMFRPRPELLSTVKGKGEMATVRGSLLPIVRLHQRFNLEPRVQELTEGMLVVVESQGKQYCLFVDDLIGKQEVVIKSLGETFKDVVGLAGCAILGDGRVGLILDIDGIFRGRA